MEKFKKFLYKNKKTIFICLAFIFVFSLFSSSIFAKINRNSYELTSNTDESLLKKIADAVINTIGSVAAGTVMKILNVFVMAAAAMTFLALWAIWGLLGGSLFNLPFPDRIVFNEMSIFDPNFINPTRNSELIASAQSTNIMEYIYDVASGLYFTFFIVAGFLMVVAAMVIGIKMALSSIAIEKAQYKETLNKWIFGVVLLFCLHFLILGIFTINEEICNAASKIAGDTTITLDFTGYSIVTKIAGKVIGFFKGLINGDLGNEENYKLKWDFEGYGGIIFYLIFAAVLNGDLIASLTLLAIMGQSINLIFKYLKRFILIIFMAIISPLVVAVDVIKRAI